ncbi:hypothetical protein COU18_03420 [Candidatus Kaiserbacteria bacterium CG10_big_fil_rev_8_21_14_0_10_51_14]|uniref:PABS domain-containing protein n=1 Tax=Candidatus Kaiserbacteria bacterium CG10_big_fil_rev_8_21_14_0_10_51_14 TaxID=1974610 RepID=A0A2H0UBA5_9BACT|nr:MAG: hypothetical protein COU18_03420 [Candidatus Kaiserbacteria bacterium CG10_big_fil_rev_8_21_14_0_10_51_14]
MRIVLPIIVFCSGAIVMILELTASRIVAPYLGTSVIIWTSLIGVILAALAVGNWLGGRIADRYPMPHVLAPLLLGGAVLIALITQFESLLSVVSTTFDPLSAAVVGVCVLFGPATIILGTIAPFAVKLSLATSETSGRIVGNLFAVSNAGSIIGTFLGGFILISLIGSTRIIMLIAITLACLAFLVLIVARKKPSIGIWIGVAVLAILLMAPQRGMVVPGGGKLVADVDTLYSRTWIVEESFGEYTARTMRNSFQRYQSGILIEHPDVPLFAYIRMYDVFEAFAPEATHALMIGGSAYTYPRYFLAQDSSRYMTVVEIDPGVTELARQHFGLTDDPRLTIVHEDGRTYLNSRDEDYEVIFIDAFNSNHTIPFHLTTHEAIHAISRNLAPHGIVMMNIISPLEGGRSAFLAAEYATYREVFPYVKLYQVDLERGSHEDQNIMLIASHQELTPEASSRYAAELAEKEWRGEIAQIPPLTDDFAPVERYTSVL